MRRALSLGGILGGGMWILLAFFPPEWGPPGSQAYLGYQLWNRLWTPALIGMFLGFLGFYLVNRLSLNSVAGLAFGLLLFGLAMMILGNVAEFWVFTDVPYSGGQGPNIRDLAWMTFLLGSVLALVGSMGAGLASLSKGDLPRRLATAFALALLVTIAVAAISLSLAAVPLGILSVITSTSQFIRSGPAAGRAIHA